MILSKYDHYKTIDIWTLRGHDNVVLVNASRLNKAIKHYRITFSKNKRRKGAHYYLSYKAIVKSPKEWHETANGTKILRYAVPESRLEDLIFDQHPVESWL